MKYAAINFLISNQNSDGGWGYAAGQNSIVEPTSAVLLALIENSSDSRSFGLAIDWLRRIQHQDGGWGFNSLDLESSWQTAWAVLVLALTKEGRDASDRGVKWLLSVKTAQLSQHEIQDSKKILTIDLKLRGWPWLPGEASWIEPTALTMLSLGSVNDRAATERLHEAYRYIQDRRCPGGGWNVGTPTMFNSVLPARAHSTSLVLLALFKVFPGGVHSEDISILRREMHCDGGILSLAWGLLALRTLGKDDALAEDRLSKLQGQNGGWGNDPYKTAVVLMALRGKI